MTNLLSRPKIIRTVTFIVVGIALFISQPSLGFAQGSGVELFTNPPIPTQGGKTTDPPIVLPNLINRFGGQTTPQIIFVEVLRFLLLVAGLLAFIYVIYGGAKYITSGGNPAAADAGRKAVTGSIVGLIIIALSYVVVEYIIRAITH